MALVALTLQPVGAKAQFTYTMEYVDNCIFQQDRAPAGARQKLDSHLTVHIDEIERACKLTEAQKKKLQLAGRGDIKHFFDRYEHVKRNFKPIDQNHPEFQEVWQKLWQEISPLQQSMLNGLFEDESLFAKSVSNTLTPAQRNGYETLAEERRQFNWKITISQAIEMLDRSMRMTKAQRKHLSELLAKETRPSKKLLTAYEQYYLFWQLEKLPPTKFRPLFDETQLKVLDRHLQQAKNVARSLQQSKNWPTDESADDADKASIKKPAAAKKKQLQ
ncbi:hypothetical protein BH10PLA2_BH10PLA2_35420 [soil metagenome]